MQKRHTSLIIFASLTGCAQPIVTKEKINNYALLAPQQYVETRFIHDEANPILDKIDDVSHKLLKSIDFLVAEKPKKKQMEWRPRLDTDGTVFWTAYYTKMNYIQLLRPFTELRRFCELQGGTMDVVAPYSENMVARFKKDPLAEYIFSYAYIRQRFATSNPVGMIVTESAALKAATESADKAIWHNKNVDDLYASEALMYAQRLNALGGFKCVGKTPDHTWAASVLPAYIEAANPNNLLEPGSLRMAIKIHQLSSGPRPENVKQLGLPPTGQSQM